MSLSCDVVITGMGVVSPIGNDIDSFWKSIQNGVSGVRNRDIYETTDWPLRLCADVKDFDGKQYVRPRKSLKVMCPPIQFGYAAAQMAMAQSGLGETVPDPDRAGTIFGAEAFYANPDEVAPVIRKCIEDHKYIHKRWGENFLREIMPLWMLKYLPNMVASHISIANDARGPSNSICQSDVGSLLAIIEGIDLIERGLIDVAIVGGTGSLMATTSMIYRGCARLSKRIEDPAGASRPFDMTRDGAVAGEGAGSLVLESRQHAENRNAEILATIRSYARGFANSKSEMFSDRLATLINNSLQSAGFSPESIGHVNAHGMSTIDEDPKEAVAIQKVLGPTPVFAPKSYFGNLGPGADAVELIASVCAIRAGELPRTLNYSTPDADCPVNVTTETTQLSNPATLSIGFAHTGQIAVIAFD